jgi:AcrR family transcriptional regulator
MPRAFTEKEKEVIRRQLREKSQRLFELHGLRKTSVDEITAAAGISKGAFYQFYDSKEELFLEIMEEMESQLRESILGYTVQPKANARKSLRARENVSARESVRRILSRFLLTYDAYPLLKNFNQADFDYLVRKLPAERAQAHFKRDEKFFDSFIKKVKREGIELKVAPRVALHLILSLFLLNLHRQEIGDQVYAETMNILTDLVARYITEGAP